MDKHTILQTEGLTKKFGRFTAVNDLNLEVHQGDIYGFLGLNGAGKTTTIRMILRLIKPNRGNIWLYGRELNRHYLETMKNIGALVEIPAFYPYLSGWDNLALLSRMSYGRADKKVLEKLLTDVGLINRARDKVKTYSQGMRQRLGIAQALLPIGERGMENGEFRNQHSAFGNTPLIILDEPTNGLDPQGISEMRNLIQQLNKNHGVTFFVSSHLLYEIELLCNRVGIIKEGRLAAQGYTANLLQGQAGGIKLRARPSEKTKNLLDTLSWIEGIESGAANGARPDSIGEWLLKAPAERIPELTAWLVKNNIEVLEIAPKQVSLEEYFLGTITDEHR